MLVAPESPRPPVSCSTPLDSPAPWRFAARPVPHSWLVFALLGALLAVRQPQDFLAPQLNAEEGAIFFQEAYNRGFLASFFTAEAGYYHLLLRLTAGLALLGPLELVPWVFKAVSFAVQMLPVAYLLADGMAGFVVSPVFRVAVAALYVAGPNSNEIYVNATNSQWHLTLAACLILLSAWRPGKARRIADTGVLVLFSLSGPFSLVCLPLAAWRWWRDGVLGVDRTRHCGPALAVFGALVQLAYLLMGQRLAGGAEQYAGVTVPEAVRILGLHGGLNSLLGMHFVWRHGAAFPSWLPPLAAGALALVAVAVIRLRNAALAVLAGLAAVSVAVVFLFPLNDPRLWLRPEFGPRYFFFTTLALLFGLLAMAERGGWGRRVAAPLLAVALLFGVRGDFVVPPLPDNQWREQIAVFRTLPAGESFYIPIHPHQEWGVTLVKKEDPVASDPAGGLQLSAYPLFAPLGAVREVCEADGDRMVVFEGFAIDAAAGRPAGGVVLVVDGRRYPAVTGVASQEAAALTDGPAYDDAGFYRSVPAEEFGPGVHRVEVWASDDARKLLLKTTPTFLRSPAEADGSPDGQPDDLLPL
jgi:hypothetical protein